MGCVIEREFTDEVGGFRDHASTYEAAELISRKRLDRRRNYAIIRGEVCELIEETHECSGCSCDCGDGYPCGHGAGGCHECGYTGKSRSGMWIPIRQADIIREMKRNPNGI